MGRFLLALIAVLAILLCLRAAQIPQEVRPVLVLDEETRVTIDHNLPIMDIVKAGGYNNVDIPANYADFLSANNEVGKEDVVLKIAVPSPGMTLCDIERALREHGFALAGEVELLWWGANNQDVQGNFFLISAKNEIIEVVDKIVMTSFPYLSFENDQRWLGQAYPGGKDEWNDQWPKGWRILVRQID